MTLTAEQRELRKQGIGSSDIAAVCGLHPYRAPIDVWLEKTGKAEPQPENEQTELGHLLEAQIAELYVRATGAVLVRSHTYVGPEPWMVATPDYDWDADDSHVECKNVGYRMVHHWPERPNGGHAVPEYVTVQGLWQLEVTLRARVHVSALLGGRDRVVETIMRDESLGRSLVEIAGDFWTRNVLADLPPKVDGSESYRAYLAEKFAKVGKPAIPATPEAEEIAQRFLKADDEMKRAKIRRDEAAYELQSLIGDAAGMYAKTWRASWPQVAETEIKGYTRKSYRAFTLKGQS